MPVRQRGRLGGRLNVFVVFALTWTWQHGLSVESRRSAVQPARHGIAPPIRPARLAMASSSGPRPRSTAALCPGRGPRDKRRWKAPGAWARRPGSGESESARASGSVGSDTGRMGSGSGEGGGVGASVQGEIGLAVVRPLAGSSEALPSPPRRGGGVHVVGLRSLARTRTSAAGRGLGGICLSVAPPAHNLSHMSHARPSRPCTHLPPNPIASQRARAFTAGFGQLKPRIHNTRRWLIGTLALPSHQATMTQASDCDLSLEMCDLAPSARQIRADTRNEENIIDEKRLQHQII